MILAMVWKEWREQRTIALAVLVFGLLAMSATAQFVDPTGGGTTWAEGGARELMALSLAYLAGAVCGAVLLADEKEVGTLEFLDSMPSRRRDVWLGKMTFGFVFVIVQCVTLALLAFAIGCVDQRMTPFQYGTMAVLVGLLAYAWGMFGGAMARTTLGAVFQGSLVSFFVAIVLAIPFLVFFGPRAFNQPFGRALILFYMVWLAVGVIGSGLIFAATDRKRTAPRIVNGVEEATPRRQLRGPGVRALVWLTTRQAVYIALGAFAAGAVLGATMLAPDVVPIFLWMGATLAFGVLAGVTTLGEEQTRGIASFWAERRLPLGRMWLTKVSVHFVIAVLAAAIAFLPLYAAMPGLPFRSRLLVGVDPGLRSELWRLLLLSLVYGFVVGQLAGMIFRKTIVAGLAAAVTAATFVALILPAVIGGGASRWQVWGPAVVLLLTARVLLYPWATDRVMARGPAVRVAAGFLLAFGVLGAGLAYRVYEIPDRPDRLAESGFEASLPSRDSTAGRDARAVVAQYRRAANEARGRYPSRASGLPTISPVQYLATEQVDPLIRVAQSGWGQEVRVLEPWLDQMFALEWPKLLEQLPTKPAAVFEDPRDLDYFNSVEAANDLRELAAAVRARGMQRLAVGDPDTYARQARGMLAAIRTARTKCGIGTALLALDAEETVLGGLTEWLSKHDARPDLLRELLAELIRHEREMPTGTGDAYWVEQIFLRNTMERVGTWLPRQLNPTGRGSESRANQLEAESEVVAIAWNVPWERARRERILRAHTDPENPADPHWLSGLHLTPYWRAKRTDRILTPERRGLTHRRLVLLDVALRVYQVDRGEPAASLVQLVPTFLPAAPIDPYSDKPFGYRLSGGEELSPLRGEVGHAVQSTVRLAIAVVDVTRALNAWAEFQATPARGSGTAGFSLGIPPPPTPVKLTAKRGDAILWSVGADLQDNGGYHPAVQRTPTIEGEDWIIVVPTQVGK
ncbi:MAG TPA: ABC transporter permease [Gemmataceae bacterium]|nr:ABC transporter permease [Gemmataceae bacterium]